MNLRAEWTMASVPLLLPAGAMCCGVALAGACAPVWGWVTAVWLWIAMAVAATAVLVLMAFRRLRWAVCPLMFLAGCGAMMLDWPVEVRGRDGDSLLGHEAIVSGEVVAVRDYSSLQKCVVRSGRMRIGVSLYDYQYTVVPGDRVIFRAVLHPPVRETSVPDEYNGLNYAVSNRLGAVCSPADGEFAIARVAGGFRGWLNEVRTRFSDIIDYSGMTQSAAKFLKGVLLGEDNIDPAVREIYTRAGLAHVMALSGTHVSTMALLVAILMFPLQLAGMRRTRLLLTLAALWAYALITGMSPSVVRSVFMASMIVFARLSWRKTNSINSLSAAVVVILLVSPVSLFRPGFQLSVLGVAGIVLFMPPVLDAAARLPFGRRGWFRAIVSLIALPAAAVLATAPLASWHFHNFPAWFMASNVPVSLILPFFLCGGAVLLISGCFGICPAWLTGFLDRLYDFMTAVAQRVGDMPGWTWTQQVYFSGWLLPVFYLSLLLIWGAWRRQSKILLLAGIASMMLFFVLPSFTSPDYPERESYAYITNFSSNIIHREGRDVYIITDNSSKHFGEISRQAERRLADYLGHREAAIKMVASDSLQIPGVMLTDDFWMVDGVKISLVRNLDFIRPADIYLVTRRFKGDILAVADAAGGNPLILSEAIYRDRRKTLAAKLDSASIHYYTGFDNEMLRKRPGQKSGAVKACNPITK